MMLNQSKATIKCYPAIGNRPMSIHFPPFGSELPIATVVERINRCSELVEIIGVNLIGYFEPYVAEATYIDQFSVLYRDQVLVVEGIVYGDKSPLYKRVVITHKNEIGYPVVAGEVFDI